MCPGARDVTQAKSEARMAAAVRRLEAQPWPAPVLGVLRRLAEGTHQAWLVGGTVRDALLGRVTDGTADVATDLAPEEVAARFAHTEPIGIRHGTLLILEGETRVECTTLREEGAYDDARRPSSVRFTDDPVRDLARRDLTINALAWDPFARRLLDPFGGLSDLEAGILRAVGDPRERFAEDALRPLRLARFAAQLEMAPDAATLAAMAPALPRSAGLAAERIRAELLKMMESARPSVGWELLQAGGWLARVLPELGACVGVTQNRHHAHDVYVHTLKTVDAAPAAWRAVRWAALLHDVGKPGTRAGMEGAATFHGHEALGARLALARLEALRFPIEERDEIVHLVREHMFDYAPEWSDAAVRRWVRRVGPERIPALFALREADVAGTGVDGDAPSVAEFRTRIDAVLAAGRILRVRDLPVDGEDVMRVLGCGPGPRVGVVLETLLDAVIENPEVATRESLLRAIETARDSRGDDTPGP
jgi:tRNA nucleotidyltransferase (CCA-adding enzyme)